MGVIEFLVGFGRGGRLVRLYRDLILIDLITRKFEQKEPYWLSAMDIVLVEVLSR